MNRSLKKFSNYNIFKIFDKSLIIFLSLVVFTFIFYPFLKVFLYSFYKDNIFTFKGFEFLKTEYKLIINTIIVGILTVIITLIVSLSISIYYYFSGNKLRNFINFILMLTTISPPFVSSLAYIKLFGRRGFITNGILGFSLNSYGLFGIVLMQSIGFVSISALMIISFTKKIDRAQIASASSLGAGTSNIILDIIIPQLKSIMNVVCILTFIRSIADFSTPLIIGGSFETLSSRAYLTFIAEGDLLKAGAMNVVICIPVIILFYFYFKSSKKVESYNIRYSSVEIKLDKIGYLFFIIRILTVIFISFLFLQYFAIIISAFTDYRQGSLYFTLEHFTEIGEYIGNTIYRSVTYAIISAFFGSVIGLLIQYYLCIRNIKFFKFVDFISTMPYILPGTFFGIGYILSFNDYPIYITGTALIVILNVTFKQLPFPTKMFNASMNRIDRNQILSARDLGANEFYVFKDVVIPNNTDSFIVSMVNGFNSTMTTIGSIIFLVYPTQKLLTLIMFDVINSGKYNIASVIALVIIYICIVFSLILFGLKFFFEKLGDRNVFRIKKYK